ncbi:MAG: DUF1501 domain-containing protein [Planctomycetes bacterium]|nr:DUF1501 domain-containing protein [Planctomycetota bacterium]
MNSMIPLTRRTFLRDTAAGMGLAALASLVDANSGPLRGSARQDAARQTGQPGVIQPHLPVKAKRIIWLYMAGGMSHLESFDPKPQLARMNGQPMPTSFTAGQPIAQLQGAQLRCFAPQHPFRRYGRSGQEIAEIFPHIGSIADDICIVRSLKTDAINHDPAHTFMNTGTTISGRPAMGSWLSYGLGCEADDLPAFCVLTSTGRYGQSQPIAQRQWSAGMLPSRHQGIHLRGTGDPVLYLTSPAGVDQERQRDVVDAVQQLNRLHDGVVDDPEIATRISQYEMAFRMQTSVPALRDFAQESLATLGSYGINGPDGSFGANCLMARRLAERGVRFIQLYHRDWDHHGSVKEHMRGSAGEVDQATAALVKDLKSRGMLDDTLIVFGSEFGRTPMAQGNGRDHHMKGFSVWLAGGGIKGGMSYGNTDELGYNAIDPIVTVHDLHATMLHLLGIDHLRLTYRFQSRDFRLTDVSGNVVDEILA